MNPLIAYFSATGTTAKAAKLLAGAVGGTLYEIRPAVPYTSADLNWMDKNSRSSVEMNDKHSRPALADHAAPVADYDVVFLGFPIWWYVAPTILNTFLEAYDFTGKTIVLFATSGGSGLGKSAAVLRASAPGARIVDGLLLNGRLSEMELKSWVSGLNLCGKKNEISETGKF
jgi:flavodoxin